MKYENKMLLQQHNSVIPLPYSEVQNIFYRMQTSLTNINKAASNLFLKSYSLYSGISTIVKKIKDLNFKTAYQREIYSVFT